MAAVLKRESNNVTLSTFYENHSLKKYNFNAPYQRQSVWSPEKQSFLIDSILRNYPIPPIFLHQHIDPDSGRTTYDVIDGKQRLTAIIDFIENKIPVSSEEAESDDDLIGGCYFRDLDKPDLQEYKKSFWRYSIPIEYIDTDNRTLIENIFDRLNRNGERLNGQELRNAQYNRSALWQSVRNCSDDPVWLPRLSTLDTRRMEDQEFISELLFCVLEQGPCEGSQRRLDDLYQQYAGSPHLHAAEARFKELSISLTEVSLGLNLAEAGVSHLYGLWTFAEWLQRVRGENVARYADQLIYFYERFFQKQINGDEALDRYKRSVTYRTRTRGQRQARLEAIRSFVGLA